MADGKPIEVEAAGRAVRVSSPDRVVFPASGATKRDLAEHWVAVADVVGVHLRDRPASLHRFPKGLDEEAFFQKHLPKGAPDWLQTATVSYPSGRTGRQVVLQDAAHLVWAAQMGTIDVHAWPVRRPELDAPDELRVDLDPTDETGFDVVREVAVGVRELLAEHGLRGHVKTSGSRGLHVYAPVRPSAHRGFDDVRRAAVALAREMERRMPGRASASWWKAERRGVFLDFNQNARDRTIAAPWSVRAVPDARVSVPLRWEEVPTVDPAAFTLRTVPARIADAGDPWAGMAGDAGELDGLLELARIDEEERGLPDAPWPPHFRRRAGEAPRKPPGGGA